MPFSMKGRWTVGVALRRPLARLDSPSLGFEEVVQLRRRLHERPELAFQETFTASTVRERLKAIEGVRVLERASGGTGVIAVIQGGREGGKTILFRADLDGLPIEEKMSGSSSAGGGGDTSSSTSTTSTSTSTSSSSISSSTGSSSRSEGGGGAKKRRLESGGSGGEGEEEEAPGADGGDGADGGGGGGGKEVGTPPKEARCSQCGFCLQFPFPVRAWTSLRRRRPGEEGRRRRRRRRRCRRSRRPPRTPGRGGSSASRRTRA